jgi:hypothetical protein
MKFKTAVSKAKMSWRIHFQTCSNNPTGLNKNTNNIPLYLYFIIKDTAGFIILLKTQSSQESYLSINKRRKYE